MFSSVLLGADLGDGSTDDGPVPVPVRPGGVVLLVEVTMGDAEAARWARLASP